MNDDETKKQLHDDLTFLSGMFTACCLDREVRALFMYGIARLQMYLDGTLEDEEEKPLTEELMRSYQ